MISLVSYCLIRAGISHGKSRNNIKEPITTADTDRMEVLSFNVFKRTKFEFPVSEFLS